MLSKKHVLLVISGGIAAYKMPALIRKFVKSGAEVKVIMTPAANAFVSSKTLAVVSGNTVIDESYLNNNTADLAHLDLSTWADFIVVAPATANLLAKLANGLADNLATTTILATSKPVYLFPAMNDQMYQQPATQRNIKQLQHDGRVIFEPEVGFLAEGYEAKGRLPEPETIVALITAAEHKAELPKPLTGKRVLVTAGGTREKIDPVRYIGNHSSGKMGTALALAAQEAGALVTLITTRPYPCEFLGKVIQVVSTAELKQEVEKEFKQTNVLIMAAAPADFKMKLPLDKKIKKQPNQDEIQLTLIKNPDILAGLTRNNGQFIVGFAAETNDLLANASKKLNQKNLDLIVANQVGQVDSGFNAETNKGTILTSHGEQIELPLMTKAEMAQEIIKEIAKIIS